MMIRTTRDLSYGWDGQEEGTRLVVTAGTLLQVLRTSEYSFAVIAGGKLCFIPRDGCQIIHPLEELAGAAE